MSSIRSTPNYTIKRLTLLKDTTEINVALAQLESNMPFDHCKFSHRYVVIKSLKPAACSEITKQFEHEQRYYQQFQAQAFCPTMYEAWSLGLNEFLTSPCLIIDYLSELDLSHPIRTFTAILVAVHQLHLLGYCHGDLKLSHCKQAYGSRLAHSETGHLIKLLDFGQVRPSSVETNRGRSRDCTINAGTPAYMSPQRFAGCEPTLADDIYALGIIGYQLLCNQKPYHAKTYYQWGLVHSQQAIPLLPTHWRLYQPVIDKFLAKLPDHRYQNLAVALAHLQAIPNALSHHQII